MPGYTVSPARAPAIAAGRQIGLLYAPRDTPTTNPHADVGETVTLNAARTKAGPMRPILAGPCILRARLIMTPDALLRAAYVDRFLTGQHAQRAENVVRMLTNAEQGAAGKTDLARRQLARILGYASWDEAYAHNRQAVRRGRPDAHGRIERILIVWGVDDVQDEAVAA